MHVRAYTAEHRQVISHVKERHCLNKHDCPLKGILHRSIGRWHHISHDALSAPASLSVEGHTSRGIDM